MPERSFYTYKKVKALYFKDSSDIALATQKQIDRLIKELNHGSGDVQKMYDLHVERYEYLLAENKQEFC